MRKLGVYFNTIPAGTLCEESPSSYSFAYLPQYLADNNYPSIAFEFPKSARKYRSDRLFPFFANLLPEGKNKAVICRHFRIDENDDFGLLAATSDSDCIGAVSVGEAI